MLRALPPGFADHAAHDQRHLHLAVIHVARLAAMLTSWFIASIRKSMRICTWIGRMPGHRRADRDAGHRVFGQRRAEHPLGAEFLTSPRVEPWIAL